MDRFGQLPQETQHLFKANILALRLQNIGIKKVSISNTHGRFYFGPNPSIDTMKLIQLIQQQPHQYQMEQQTILKFKLQAEHKTQLFSHIHAVLKHLI